jgi:PAS domain S-box-containing protein
VGHRARNGPDMNESFLPRTASAQSFSTDVAAYERSEEPESGPRARIVWADDNADVREYVRRLLAPRYDVDAVADGEAALAAVRQGRADLVLADVMMPKLDGLGLVRALRADPRTRATPVILLSARAGEEGRIEGFNAGADDYVVKPFSERELMARVEAHLTMARVRREAAEAVGQSERRLREMIDLLPAAIYTTDAQGCLTHFNPAAVEFSGRVPVLGSDHWCVTWRLYYPDGTPMPHDKCPMAVALKEGRAVRGTEAVAERPDGTRIWFEPYPTPVFNADGELVGGINMLVDITARKLAEEALRDREKRLSVELSAVTRMHQVSTRLLQGVDFATLLCDILDAAIEITTADMGNIQLLDGGALKIVAQRGFEAPFLDFFNGVHEGQAACGTAMLSGERVIVEDVANSPIFAGSAALEVMMTANARAVQSTPLISRSGRMLGMFSMHYHVPRRPNEHELRLLDILARQAADLIEGKQAEGAKARLAAIVESSDDAIVSKDLDGVITSWNRGAERLFGYTAQEAIGQPVTILIPPDRFDEEPHILERVRRGERLEHYETTRRHKDGMLLQISLTVSPIIDGEGRIVGASKIARDISAHVAARRAVEESREVLREADRRKDEFLGMLSHELRSPLNVVLGWVRMLRSGTLDEATARRALEVIDRSVHHQSRLITDLLDISRIVSGKLTLQQSAVDLSPIVASVVEAMRPSANAKALALTLHPADGAVPVHGDAERLRQVVANLLSNAVKFTPSGGQVTVRVARASGRVRMAVSDTGKGITQDFLPYIFDRFRQADSTGTRAEAGLGLGLAIVRHIVELHGGSVSAESAGQGKGATFTVDLPMTAPSVDGVVDGVEMAGSSTNSLDGIRVLIVDDDADSRDLLTTILVRRGAVASAVASAREALSVARRLRLDVLVCDLAMPGDDGCALIRAVRSWPAAEGGSVQAVALTAYARPEDRERALRAGFQLHLAKPVEPGALIEAVAQLAGGVPRHR